MSSFFDIKFKDESFDVNYVDNLVDAGRLLHNLRLSGLESKLFGIDTETTFKDKYKHTGTAALSPLLGELRIIQVFDGERVYIFDLKNPEIKNSSELKTFLETHRFVAHNANFDLKFFKHELGVKNMNIGCTWILSKLIYHAIYATDIYKTSLDALVKALFDIDVPKHAQTSNWKGELTLEQLQYAALDAVYVLKVANKLAPALSKYGLEKTYTLCKEAQHAIASLELNGFKIDVEAHRQNIGRWREELWNAKKKVLEITKLDDITGSKLGNWLEENLPKETLAIWPRTETGRISTDAHTFADFSHLEIVEPFSKFQKLSKLCSSFGTNLLAMINPETGKLHSRFNICGTRTGRLSCSEPNLQQLPRDEEVRKVFIADEGCSFVVADYSQIELRVAAELSQDKVMLDAYRNGVDLHALTASKINHKTLDKVTKAERQIAKAFNFGLLFGLGKDKFKHYAKKSYGVDITSEEASESIDLFRETYAGYREWQMGQASTCQTSFQVRTPYGKLRRLNEENSYGGSMNTPVQGGAAEVMLKALVRLQKEFENSNVLLVNCVHDEIIVMCPDTFTKHVSASLEICMTKAYLDIFPKGIIRDLVNIGVGKNWAEAK